MSRLAFLSLCCAACGTHFIEPNPPRLERAEARYQTGSAPEPIAYLAILDLFLERNASCADAHAFALQAIRAAMGGGALEIAVQDASPACNQLSTRTIDVAALDGAIRSAQAAYPDAHLRPIVVYANNIDLPLPGTLADQINSIRAHAAARVELIPYTWALAASRPADDVHSDRVVPWTYTGDRVLAASVSSLAAAELPLQTETGDVAGPLPLLGNDALGRALQFKLCKAPDYVAPIGFEDDGMAKALDRARPPAFTVAFPPRYAIARSEFKPRTVAVPVELCSAHCDRFFDYRPGDDPVIWNQVAGCLLPGDG